MCPPDPGGGVSPTTTGPVGVDREGDARVQAARDVHSARAAERRAFVVVSPDEVAQAVRRGRSRARSPPQSDYLPDELAPEDEWASLHRTDGRQRTMGPFWLRAARAVPPAYRTYLDASFKPVRANLPDGRQPVGGEPSAPPRRYARGCGWKPSAGVAVDSDWKSEGRCARSRATPRCCSMINRRGATWTL